MVKKLLRVFIKFRDIYDVRNNKFENDFLFRSYDISKKKFYFLFFLGMRNKRLYSINTDIFYRSLFKFTDKLFYL